jgi:hypothetical protein
LLSPDGLPPGAQVKVAEVPALDGGVSYTIAYKDERAEIDSPRGRASGVLPGEAGGAALLLVANESHPVAQRLSSSTPRERVFHAGMYETPAYDDRASGRVRSATGDTLVRSGARCALAFHYYGTTDGQDKCDVLVQCGPVVVIGRPELFSSRCTRRGARVLAAVDPEPQPQDADPALILDERSARIWNDAADARWSVTIALDPR